MSKKQQRCPYLSYPIRDPCDATPAQCPKSRLKRKVSEFCHKVKIPQKKEE
jgi:hypothetical protein